MPEGEVNVAKILVWDLEKSPHDTMTYGLFNQNIPHYHVTRPGRVISFAAKWRGSKEVEFYSVFHHGVKVMLERAAELLNEADALLSWNGAKYDTPQMKTEFALEGMSPPASPKEIDLLKAAKTLRLPSNKLDAVAGYFGVGKKLTHEGMPLLWMACAQGDEKALNRLRRYNIQDVKLLDGVLYERLRPYLPGHPNLALVDGLNGLYCPYCTSSNIRRDGHRTTNAGKYQRYYCKACGGRSHDPHRVATTGLRVSA